MARGRLVATDIFEDDFFMGLDNLQRLVWLGLIVRVADDQGRLQDNPALIRSAIFPADDVTTQEVETALILFAQSNRIERYTADGKRLIQIVNWWKYQTPAWAARSRYAAPAGWTDRIKMHTSGTNSVTKENWDHPGGYAVPFVDEIPGEGGEEIRTHVRTWVGTWVRTPVGMRLRKGIKLKLKLKLKLNNKNLKDSVPFDKTGGPSAATPPAAIAATPSKDAELEREVLQYWKEKFPTKPQPRAGTYRAKIVTRFKSSHFRENWKAALDRAARSETLKAESWFNFEFFVRDEKNYQKMLDGWMDWKDKRPAPAKVPTADIIARVFAAKG